MPKAKPRELTHLATGDLRQVELTRVGSALTLEIVNLEALYLAPFSLSWTRRQSKSLRMERRKGQPEIDLEAYCDRERSR